MSLVKFLIMMTGELQQKNYVFFKINCWVNINCNVLADSKFNTSS